MLLVACQCLWSSCEASSCLQIFAHCLVWRCLDLVGIPHCGAIFQFRQDCCMNYFPANINWSLVKLSMDKINLFFGCLTDVGDVLGPGQV